MKKRILSIWLSVCMVLTMLPISAMAKELGTTIGAKVEIIAFAPIDETEMSVSTGTSMEDLGLPKSLMATVRTAVNADSKTLEDAVQDSGNSDKGSVSGNSAEATPGSTTPTDSNGQTETDKVPGPEWKETTANIPVTWTSEPEYDMDAEGVYVFTPVIEDYVVSAELPQITVTVGAKPMMMALRSGTPTPYGDFYVSIDEDGAAPVYDNGVLTFSTAGEYTVSMADSKTSTTNRIAVSATGVTLNLNGVTIDALTGSPGVPDGANALTVTSSTVTLNVIADSSLTGGIGYTAPLNGGKGGAGISGNVTVTGAATLTATGGMGATVPLGESCDGGAGIFGNVTVMGTVMLTATGGMGGQHGTVTVTGGSGISGNLIVTGSATVSATGGKGFSMYETPGNALGGTLTAMGFLLKGGFTGFTDAVTSDDYRLNQFRYISVAPVPNVAEIGSAGYPTLQAAMTAVAEGQTIKLLESITITDSSSITIGGTTSFALDLNGKTLDGGTGSASLIKHNGSGTLTIVDGGTGGKIINNRYAGDNGGTVELSGGNGNLILMSGTVENISSFAINNQGSGTVSIQGGAVRASFCGIFTKSGNVGVSGGVIEVTGGVASTAISSNAGGTITLSGGIMCSPNGIGISMNGGGLVVSGNSPIIQGGYYATNYPPILDDYANGEVIASTSYDGNDPVENYNSDNLSSYKHLTFEAKITPTAVVRWGVAKEDGSAPDFWINSGTLDEAIIYANEVYDGTVYIQLLTDIDKDNHNTWPLTFNNFVTPIILDLNGNDIDRGLTAATSNGNVITANCQLTIKDSSTDEVSGQGYITGGYNSDDTGGGVYVNGIVTMQGGNIIGNKSTSSSKGGGGVMVGLMSSFIMEGGSIAGNEASNQGGAVYALQGSFTMTGGSITGNKSPNGGIYALYFRVGGTALIKDNTVTDSSTACNVVLTSQEINFVDGVPLTTGASIGVTIESGYDIPAFVTKPSSYDCSAYFFSDDSRYIIQYNDEYNMVQLVVSEPIIGSLTIPDSFTAGSSVMLSNLNSSYKPTVTENGVTITAQGWQYSVDSGDWNIWSIGELPLDTASTYKLRYYVTYNGDSGSTTITSNDVTLNVVGNTTALALAASPASQQIMGSSVTLTATLTGYFTGPGVSGQEITFKNGGTVLGKENLSTDGIAVFTWTPGDTGTFALTAEYAASPYNTAATSSTINYTVIVDPDIAIVAAAKTAAANESYADMSQTAAIDEDAIKAALKNTAETVVNNRDITVTINKVGYTAPIAGTSANPSGTNGSYIFIITVSKGSQNEATIQKNIIITATPYTGGTDGGGGYITPAPSTKPTEPVTGSTENKATVDGKGNANVSLTDKNITDAIADAKAEAAKKGVNAGDITAVIHVTTGGKDANTVTVNLPKTTQEQVIDNKISSVQLVIDRPDLTIGINLAAVTEINRQAKADVQLSATRIDNAKLSGDAKAVIGNRPAYDLKATYASGKSVTDFGKGSVSVEIPYTLQKGEIADNVYAVYVDAKGKVTYLTDSSYDARRGTVVFSTSHFSTYGIAYKAGFNFTDINGHWAKDDILFAANRGLMTGTSATTFSPNDSMTRGMFVTALGRLADADVSGYTKSSFADVKANAYYMGYIEWGVKNNILVGIGEGKFDPNAFVTREQMAVIMDRYAVSIGFKLPEVHSQKIFDDNTKIGAWAAPSINRIQMAGIIQGKGNNLFDPQGKATRAEVSVMLWNFVELTIFSDTDE